MYFSFLIVNSIQPTVIVKGNITDCVVKTTKHCISDSRCEGCARLQCKSERNVGIGKGRLLFVTKTITSRMYKTLDKEQRKQVMDREQSILIASEQDQQT